MNNNKSDFLNKSVRIIRKFCERFFRPYKYFFNNISITFLWIIFVIIGGFLGVLINLVSRCYFGNLSIYESLYIDSVSGNFYTYALVLITSILGPIYIKIIENQEFHYRKIKMYVASFGTIIMIASAVFYSFQANNNITHIDYNDITIDWAQLILIFSSIALAIYSYGTEYIDKDRDNNKDIDEDYYNEEENTVNELRTEQLPRETGGISI